MERYAGGNGINLENSPLTNDMSKIKFNYVKNY